MKKLYTAILLTLLSLNIFAQQPWAQPGTHWCYKDGDDVGIG